MKEAIREIYAGTFAMFAQYKHENTYPLPHTKGIILAFTPSQPSILRQDINL
ncbi:hypothetical protein GCM10007852_23290 [Agaribacter marinus]|uniref:Uncharacterized protein n=1 Tax=Agaribacter marinus TaxID=1431249 RepID=A0AA37SX40_9ALTE|nr:hypothetical protein GCM10007852_23290 [Agaribacter marinus]